MTTAVQPPSTPYDTVATEYDRLVRPRYTAIAAFVAERATEVVDLRHAHVVELSAGTGALTNLLAPLAAHYTATDVSARMLEVARERADIGADRLAWALADIADIGFPSACADLVVSSLGPCQDSVLGLREASRLLRADGWLVVSTWGDDYSELELLQRAGRRLGLPQRPVTTAGDLRDRLRAAGLVEPHVGELRLPAVHESVSAYLAYRKAFGAPADAAAPPADVRRVLSECAADYTDRHGRVVLDWHLLIASARRPPAGRGSSPVICP